MEMEKIVVCKEKSFIGLAQGLNGLKMLKEFISLTRHVLLFISDIDFEQY